MKKSLLSLSAVFLTGSMLGGCAILDYAKERKATICAGVTEGKCPEGFKEIDVARLPTVGSTTSLVANRILTCANYGKEDVDCPKNTKKLVIDLIK